MKQLRLMPANFEMTLSECPPGHFLFDGKYVGFKSEYRTPAGEIEAFNEAGEFFSPSSGVPRGESLVVPLYLEWIEVES